MVSGFGEVRVKLKAFQGCKYTAGCKKGEIINLCTIVSRGTQ